ncbi:MAG: ABC transporter substrate-binding protein [Planctomycetota bacterium]|nr:ABC transporter substrate-binding protein [Planctomycetota bacterium]
MRRLLLTPRQRLVALVLVLFAFGCAEPAGDATTEADEIRIVSLSPAISRTLLDLGLEERIVGRSPFCDFLDPAIPVVGDLHGAQFERLIELDPTHVLVQSPQAGIDPGLRELADEHGWKLAGWRGVNTIDDIEAMVRELPTVLCEPGSDELAALGARSAELLNEIAAALAPGETDDQVWRGRTLLVYAMSPLGVFGRGTYLNDVLVRCGAGNAVEAEGWVQLTLEDVTRLDPGAIILIRPGPRNQPAEPVDPIDAAGALATLDIEAARAERIAILSHPDALMPSTAISEVAAELRDVLRRLNRPSEPGS